jgi:hypothetical protein
MGKGATIPILGLNEEAAVRAVDGKAELGRRR